MGRIWNDLGSTWRIATIASFILGIVFSISVCVVDASGAQGLLTEAAGVAFGLFVTILLIEGRLHSADERRRVSRANMVSSIRAIAAQALDGLGKDLGGRLTKYTESSDLTNWQLAIEQASGLKVRVAKDTPIELNSYRKWAEEVNEHGMQIIQTINLSILDFSDADETQLVSDFNYSLTSLHRQSKNQDLLIQIGRLGLVGEASMALSEHLRIPASS